MRDGGAPDRRFKPSSGSLIGLTKLGVGRRESRRKMERNRNQRSLAFSLPWRRGCIKNAFLQSDSSLVPFSSFLIWVEFEALNDNLLLYMYSSFHWLLATIILKY